MCFQTEYANGQQSWTVNIEPCSGEPSRARGNRAVLGGTVRCKMRGQLVDAEPAERPPPRADAAPGRDEAVRPAVALALHPQMARREATSGTRAPAASTSPLPSPPSWAGRACELSTLAAPTIYV